MILMTEMNGERARGCARARERERVAHAEEDDFGLESPWQQPGKCLIFDMVGCTLRFIHSLTTDWRVVCCF